MEAHLKCFHWSHLCELRGRICIYKRWNTGLWNNHRECIGVWKWQLYWKTSSWGTFYYRNLTVQKAWSLAKLFIWHFYSLLASKTNGKRGKSFQICSDSQVLAEYWLIFHSLRSYWLPWYVLISILFQSNQFSCYKTCYNFALNFRRNLLNLFEISKQ